MRCLKQSIRVLVSSMVLLRRCLFLRLMIFRKRLTPKLVQLCVVPRTQRWSRSSRSEFLYDCIIGWLLLHPGVAVILMRVCARFHVPILKELYCCISKEMWESSKAIGCLGGALIKAVLEIASLEAASAVSSVVLFQGAWARSSALGENFYRVCRYPQLNFVFEKRLLLPVLP